MDALVHVLAVAIRVVAAVVVVRAGGVQGIVLERVQPYAEIIVQDVKAALAVVAVERAVENVVEAVEEHVRLHVPAIVQIVRHNLKQEI